MGEEGGKASAKRGSMGPVDLGGPLHTAAAQAGTGTALNPTTHLTANPKPGSCRGCGDASSGLRQPWDRQSAWPRKILILTFLSFFWK